jgi:uncharacterized protein
VLAQTKQKIYLVAGFISFGLGVIGLFLPVMPTAPFILLAAFFFSRGSEKWHNWLLAHPHFGHHIKDWNSHGMIRRENKIISTFMILVSTISVSYFVRIDWLKYSIIVILIAVIAFIWTRPSKPR